MMSLYWNATFTSRKFLCGCGKTITTSENYEVLTCKCGEVEFIVYGDNIVRMRKGKQVKEL
jgi:hypothetical protein